MNHGIAITPLDAAAILIVLAAALGYFNHRFLGLPQSVGLTLMGAVASLIVVGIDRLLPGSTVGEDVLAFITGIDFQATLMDGMLSFLLFAGALHVDWNEMRRGRWPILVLSTIGVLISTMIVGGGFFVLSQALSLEVPLVWCLVFGALISPTDPVAVMSVLKRANVGPTLEATVAGESLFNDGVGVVVFSIILATAISGDAFSVTQGLELFFIEAGGGVALGLVTGWVAFRAMRSIDEYNVEVLISLAIVMGGYALARQLHISGPVAMAVAGLLIGNHGVAHAMSDTTRDYLIKFWSLIDEILNAVLFLLIGLVVVTIPFDVRLIVVGLSAIPLVLAARAVAVMLPLAAMRPFLNLGPLAPPILIWGGLRGGISVALALSLPDGLSRSVELTATYIVVLFAVIAQGGTIARLIDRWRARYEGITEGPDA
ncbi:MAG: sodium:proton antiporter [Sphingobium sp.]|jgi:monovalent cation:H+ antiporter, CPA1 family|uniref:cation:proton antiporter n=1 Tax=Sphingobium sp. TaxID=1912891 RepID=UPI0029A69DD7|nr:sodium:proton antiporter [Sphingobium sp.]MDX3910139.1 sodium:proton antiporter [Sphingobium sp.]